MKTLQRALLPAILLFAAGARFIALDSIPDGVFPDEAQNANDGFYALTHGEPRIFYQTNSGREGLFINLVGASVWAFGHNQFGLRFWSAFIGTAAVLFIYLLGKELFSRSVGLWAGFFLATSFWHLIFSRISFRAILVPTLLTAGLYGLVRGWRTGAFWISALGGAAFGLGFHSYIAFRVTPLLVAIWLAVEFVKRRKDRAILLPWLRLTGTWLVSAILLASPIAIYFLMHPGDFAGRASSLSILDRDDAVNTLFIATAKSALMFNWKGDCLARHNLGCDPELPIPLGLLFVTGVILPFVVRKTASLMLILWTGIMLLPAVLAWEGTPHALRSIGAIPAVFLLTALGADGISRWLNNRRILKSAFIAIAIGTSFYEYYRYFAIWNKPPAIHGAMMHHLTAVARYLNSLPATTPRFVIVNDYGELDPADPAIPEKKVYTPAQTVIFLTYDHPPPTYLLVHESLETKFPAGSVIVPLVRDPRIPSALQERGFDLKPVNQPELDAFFIQ